MNLFLDLTESSIQIHQEMLDFSSLTKLRQELDEAVLSDDPCRLSKLISLNENGNNFVNVNYICSDGQTLLHKACKAGNLSMCRVLVENGASQNIKNKQGWFPIHLASYHGHLDVVLFLLNDNNFKPDSIIAVYDEQPSFIYRNKYRSSNKLKTFKHDAEISTYRDVSTSLDDSGDSDSSDEKSDESSSESSDEDFNYSENKSCNSSLLFDNKYDLLVNYNENEKLLVNLLDLKHLELTSEDFEF